MYPELHSQWLAPTGQIVEVAAFTDGGVVLRSLCNTDPEQLIAQGVNLCPTLEQLTTQHKPCCPECATFHEPEYPHQMNPHFRDHYITNHGAEPTSHDLSKHCTGLIAAALAA